MAVLALTKKQIQQHVEIYSNADILPFEWSWLDERIAAGRNPLSAVDVAELAAAGITHMVDLREEKEWREVLPGLQAVEFCSECGLRRFHWALTNVHAPRAEDFETTCSWIREALEDPNAKVYIHCRAGMERTGTIATAFFASRSGLSYESALDELRIKRPIFQPLPHQQRAVCKWLQALAESTFEAGM
jgi:protein-tyrosine phosphatase